MATAMARAFKKAGGNHEETPQEAAERIWGETHHDPVQTMKIFEEWARQTPDRMLEVCGETYWKSRVRIWLAGRGSKRNWRYGSAFEKAVARLSKASHFALMNEWRREAIRAGNPAVSLTGEYVRARAQVGRDRKRNGIKVVHAEVDVTTGMVRNVIDKEFGPFRHIRINGLELPKVTTEEARRHCDNVDRDSRFIRALCQMIPDPRKPIGDQWTDDMIREAKAIVNRRAT